MKSYQTYSTIPFNLNKPYRICFDLSDKSIEEFKAFRGFVTRFFQLYPDTFIGYVYTSKHFWFQFKNKKLRDTFVEVVTMGNNYKLENNGNAKIIKMV